MSALKKIVICLILSISFPLSCKTKFIFVHGMGGSSECCQAFCGKNKVIPIMHPEVYVRSFDLPCSTAEGHDASVCSMGQEEEIQALQEIVGEEKEEEKLILCGFSMGGATILNYAGSQKLPENIKALICIGAFDTFKNVLSQRIPYLPSLLTQPLGRLFAAKKFSPQGPEPAKTTPFIDKDLPILLIHSKEDEMVPVKSAYHLYQLLQKTGHRNVYLITLPRGKHNNYTFASCIPTLHAFYKKFNLPHDEELASQGMYLLEKAQRL